MGKTKKLGLLIIFISISIVLIINREKIWPNTENTSPTPVAPTSSETPTTPTIPSNWKIYSGETFSIAYPEGLKLDDESAGENTVKISFMGQKQIDSGRTQASLSDGYYVAISKLPPNTENLRSQAQISRDNSESGCQFEGSVVTDILQTQLANNAAYQYDVVGCFGDYTTTIVENTDGVYRVTQYYVGDDPEKSEYQSLTKQIISTLDFIN